MPVTVTVRRAAGVLERVPLEVEPSVSIPLTDGESLLTVEIRPIVGNTERKTQDWRWAAVIAGYRFHEPDQV